MPDLSQFPGLDVGLMRRVNWLVGPILGAFTPTIAVPKSFWLALTANETGEWLIHNLNVPSHLDENIYSALSDVAIGKHPNLWSITTAMLAGKPEIEIRELASSWGLTQIEGYNILFWPRVKIEDLNDATKHFPLAERLLAADVHRFGLDPTKDFEAMFHCWNSGSPAGPTHDPQYAANGILRMQIWDALVNDEVASS